MQNLKKLLLVVFGLALLTAGGYSWLSTSPRALERIKVIFPTMVLRPQPEYLDIKDTETTWEYYLIENLGVGLLRDDFTSPDGFTPLLAKSWVKTDTSWDFVLRDDLKWSDGSPITTNQILNHFRNLAKSTSRHLKYLYTATEIKLTGESNALRFSFENSPPDSFLDELSLADAVLTYPNPKNENHWAITSGPYYLHSLDSEGKLTILKNPHFRFANNYPKEALLYFPSDLENINKDGSFDLSPNGTTPFTKFWVEYPSRFEHTFNGSFSSVYYFEFKSDNWSSEMRAGFKSAITKVFEELDLPDGFITDSQIVAKGMPERLDKLPEARSTTTTFPEKKIVLNVPKNLLALAGFTTVLQKYFGDSLKIVSGKPKDCDIDFTLFLANQKESLGNWSFLLSGPLKPYSKTLDPILEKAVKAPTKDERASHLKKLHLTVLENHLAIPVMWGQGKYFHSDRISLKKWNPFDLRMRLYLIERP